MKCFFFSFLLMNYISSSIRHTNWAWMQQQQMDFTAGLDSLKINFPYCLITCRLNSILIMIWAALALAHTHTHAKQGHAWWTFMLIERNMNTFVSAAEIKVKNHAIIKINSSKYAWITILSYIGPYVNGLKGNPVCKKWLNEQRAAFTRLQRSDPLPRDKGVGITRLRL